MRIFGCKTPDSQTYAIELGHALQLTNIIRDVREDLRSDDRIYLPQTEMERFGVTEADLKAGKQTPEFRQLIGTSPIGPNNATSTPVKRSPSLTAANSSPVS